MITGDPTGRNRTLAGRFAKFGEGPFDAMAMSLTQAAYRAVFALVASLNGIDAEAAQAELARPGERSADPNWLAASRCRDVTIYLINTGLDVEQHLLARAVGLDRSGVHYALNRVEDRRDDPAVERLIVIAQRLVTGVQNGI